MTREETKRVLASISAVYPPNLMPQVTDATVNIWSQLMADLSFLEVQTVVAAWLSTNKYPPTIHDIRERIVKAKSPEMQSADEAWARAMKAIHLYGWYKTRESIAYMGERVWSAVQVIGWEALCLMTLEQKPFIFAQFRDAYNNQVKREMERAMLPQAVTEMLSQIGTGGRPAIESGEERK